MQNYLLRITFDTPVRIGLPGRDDQGSKKWIASDQVFSWISNGWLKLYGEKNLEEEIIRPFCNSQYPWIHSDLFPFISIADKDTWFMPAPKWKIVKNEGVDKKKRKPWVTFDSFIKYIESNYQFNEIDYFEPIEIHALQNVVISRKNEDNDPFLTSCSIPAKISDNKINNFSFQGYIDFSELKLIDKFQNVLDFLTDEGFGGNRSSGLGKIKNAKIIPLIPGNKYNIKNSDKQTYFVTLSPCYPNSEMLQNLKQININSINYTLVQRAGWFYDAQGNPTDYRKPKTTMFDTGSYFDFKPEGKLVDISKYKHKAFRYAIPYVIQV